MAGDHNKCRPCEHVRAAGALYPRAWRLIDEFRADRGRSLPEWPEWCFSPMAAWYAIVTDAVGMPPPLPLHLVSDVARLAALGAWRVTQGIYRFDPTLYQALVETPVSGALPEVIYHLPEWCVYLETPGLEVYQCPLAGAFAHLEWDANTGRHELRLLLDLETDDGPPLLPVPIHLGGTLADGLIEAARVARRQAVAMGLPAPGRESEELAPVLEPVVSLLLYLCSERPDMADGWPPERPRPKRTKRGPRLFPAKKPRPWDVGVRLGSALRRAAASEPGDGAGEGVDGAPRQRPRPHIRRAHWHTYRVGPGRAGRVLRWLPPIPVNLDEEELPAVIRPVKPEEGGK